MAGDPRGLYGEYTGSDKAAAAVVAMMKRTIKALPPAGILNTFNANPGAHRTQRMWDVLGERTIDRLADGARTLAVVWRSAWEEGGGEKLPMSHMKAANTARRLDEAGIVHHPVRRTVDLHQSHPAPGGIRRVRPQDAVHLLGG